VITRVDGGPVSESPFRERLTSAGYLPGYRGLVLRASPDRSTTGGRAAGAATLGRRSTGDGFN
jgi:hypothetical protein